MLVLIFVLLSSMTKRHLLLPNVTVRTAYFGRATGGIEAPSYAIGPATVKHNAAIPGQNLYSDSGPSEYRVNRPGFSCSTSVLTSSTVTALTASTSSSMRR